MAVVRLGRGHLDYMLGILNIIYQPLLGQKGVGRDMITNYLKHVLEDYTNSDFVFNEDGFVHSVFLKNVDIWGFIMSYTDLISYRNPWKNPLQSEVCNVLIKYCFGTTYATRPICIAELTRDLLALNKIVREPPKLKHYKVNKTYKFSNRSCIPKRNDRKHTQKNIYRI